MKVSVVIPVYNASGFVRKAVESALEQEQTVQVVLVEDGSSDGSLEICRQLESQYPSVSLVQHNDGGNHGAGASRNLGIRMSNAPFIAFLDADDFYLSNRFGEARKLLEKHNEIDGVYEAIGVHCQDDASRRKWDERGDGKLSAMHGKVPPEKLFDVLIEYSYGSFTLDGLTVRKSSFWKEDPFPEELKLHQDTVMMIQLSYYAKLLPGRLSEPVAMRRVHSGNRYLSDYNINRTKMMMWENLFKWSVRENLSESRIANIFRNALYFRFLTVTGRFSTYRPNPAAIPGLVWQTAIHPYLTVLALKEHRRRRSLTG